MKEILFCSILTFLNFYSVNGQTFQERQKIISDYNLKSLSNLKAELEKDFSLRQNRISKFKSNLSTKYKYDNAEYDLFDVSSDGKPVYMTSYNSDSAKATNTNDLHSGGASGLSLEGENMIIGAWDIEYPLSDHQELLDYQTTPQSRVSYPDLINIVLLEESNHATHVSGTLIAKGVQPLAKGMAPRATLRAFTASNDESEATSEAANGLLLSNHSYGVPIFRNDGSQQVSAEEIGSYNSNARNWDQITYSAPFYLPVMSAGNEGGTGKSYTGALANGYDKLTYNKTSKNSLIVASAIPVLSSGNLVNFTSSTFSSEGPTDDFRVKPDITGDGNQLYSSIATSVNSYDIYRGTSMASPNVSGSLLLLQEYYNRLNSHYMKSSTLRGLVCHNAKDNAAQIGPDAVFGWGFLDAEACAWNIKNAIEGKALVKEFVLIDGESYTYQFSAISGSSIKATICWTDPPGNLQSGELNSLTPRLVNDLDLRITDSNSNVFLPWMLNTNNAAGNAIKGDNVRDNIERIDITSPNSGNYTLTVTHKNNLTNGSQAYALILTGDNVTLNSNNDLIEDNMITLWPNPVKDHLNISIKGMDGNIKLLLNDIQGRPVFKENLNTLSFEILHSLDTSKLTSGVYFLNFNNGYKSLTKKIIIR